MLAADPEVPTAKEFVDRALEHLAERGIEHQWEVDETTQNPIIIVENTRESCKFVHNYRKLVQGEKLEREKEANKEKYPNYPKDVPKHAKDVIKVPKVVATKFLDKDWNDVLRNDLRAEKSLQAQLENRAPEKAAELAEDEAIDLPPEEVNLKAREVAEIA